MRVLEQVTVTRCATPLREGGSLPAPLITSDLPEEVTALVPPPRPGRASPAGAAAHLLDRSPEVPEVTRR